MSLSVLLRPNLTLELRKPFFNTIAKLNYVMGKKSVRLRDHKIRKLQIASSRSLEEMEREGSPRWLDRRGDGGSEQLSAPWGGSPEYSCPARLGVDCSVGTMDNYTDNIVLIVLFRFAKHKNDQNGNRYHSGWRKVVGSGLTKEGHSDAANSYYFNSHYESDKS